MLNKINHFKETIAAIYQSVFKHKLIVATTFLSSLFGILYVYIENDIFYEIGFSFLFSAMCLVSVDFFTEKMSCLKKYSIQTATLVLGVIIAFCLLHVVENDSYSWMYYLGLSTAIVCFIIYAFFSKENTKSYYGNILKHFLFSGIVCFVCFLGLLLIVFAFSNLIHKISSFEELVEALGIILFGFVFFNLYTFYIFERRQESTGKAFKIIILNILFPIYVLLLIILYGYLIKALCLFSLPKGQINWFVSFATVFYLIFYFVLKEYEDLKVVKFFYHYGALILIPLVCVQFLSCFIRINAYGFTGWRYSSLLYNIFIVIFLVLTYVKKGKYTKFAIPILGVFVIVVSLTPLNLINVGYNSQMKTISSFLKKYNYLENNQIQIAQIEKNEFELTQEEREKFVGAYNYLYYTSEHEKPDWFTSENMNYLIQKMEASTDFSSSIDEDFCNVSKYLSINQSEKLKIDIADYSTLEFNELNSYDDEDLYNSPNTFENIKIKELSFDITDAVLNCEKVPLYITIDENHKVIISEINYTYNENSKRFGYYTIDYYLLEK